MPDTSPARSETNRILFTVRRLENLPVPPSGRMTYYDIRSDLALRIESNGRKSFFWFKSARGTPVFRALGTFPTVLIDQARVEARKLQNKLEGWRTSNYAEPNPFESPDAEYTFGELLDAYVDKRVMGYSS